MGLDCTHDAFHGSYGAFNRLRQEVAHAIGGSYPPHTVKDLDDDSWYWGDGYNQQSHPGLYEFFVHSDCDGEIAPSTCILVADELEALIPLMAGLGVGHIERDGGHRQVLQRFIDGCRAAAAANEPLEFH